MTKISIRCTYNTPNITYLDMPSQHENKLWTWMQREGVCELCSDTRTHCQVIKHFSTWSNYTKQSIPVLVNTNSDNTGALWEIGVVGWAHTSGKDLDLYISLSLSFTLSKVQSLFHTRVYIYTCTSICKDNIREISGSHIRWSHNTSQHGSLPSWPKLTNLQPVSYTHLTLPTNREV